VGKEEGLKSEERKWKGREKRRFMQVALKGEGERRYEK
jgi:hypothetical protein